jgi:glycosyltransferase involved in cell wall biosynthesis
VTVGFYAPMPPAPTGVADYATALFKALRPHGHVEFAPHHCDVSLYHVGNNQHHAAIYRRALARPGVVVLHDAVLHHFLLGELDERRYVDEFVYNYGAWERGLAGELWRGRAAAGVDTRYFQYPMLKRLAQTARAVVVHNPGAARITAQHAPRTPVVEIPHLFEAPAFEAAADRPQFRTRLGFAPDAFVFAVFGYLREPKRLIQILETFACVRRANSKAALLVAGSFASPELERAAQVWLADPGVVRLPFLSTREFWLAARAADACINLRYPPAGETSGIAIRLMGLGKPVLLTDSEENARFPEDTCMRIPPGLAERDSLYRHMLLLLSIQGFSDEIGRRAADFIGTQHSLEQVARLYWDTLCEHCS